MLKRHQIVVPDIQKVESKEEYIIKLRKLLKPGGKLIVSWTRFDKGNSKVLEDFRFMVSEPQSSIPGELLIVWAVFIPLAVIDPSMLSPLTLFVLNVLACINIPRYVIATKPAEDTTTDAAIAEAEKIHDKFAAQFSDTEKVTRLVNLLDELEIQFEREKNRITLSASDKKTLQKEFSKNLKGFEDFVTEIKNKESVKEIEKRSGMVLWSGDQPYLLGEFERFEMRFGLPGLPAALSILSWFGGKKPELPIFEIINERKFNGFTRKIKNYETDRDVLRYAFRELRDLIKEIKRRITINSKDYSELIGSDESLINFLEPLTTFIHDVFEMSDSHKHGEITYRHSTVIPVLIDVVQILKNCNVDDEKISRVIAKAIDPLIESIHRDTKRRSEVMAILADIVQRLKISGMDDACISQTITKTIDYLIEILSENPKGMWWGFYFKTLQLLEIASLDLKGDQIRGIEGAYLNEKSPNLRTGLLHILEDRADNQVEDEGIKKDIARFAIAEEVLQGMLGEPIRDYMRLLYSPLHIQVIDVLREDMSREEVKEHLTGYLKMLRRYDRYLPVIVVLKDPKTWKGEILEMRKFMLTIELLSEPSVVPEIQAENVLRIYKILREWIPEGFSFVMGFNWITDTKSAGDVALPLLFYNTDNRLGEKKGDERIVGVKTMETSVVLNLDKIPGEDSTELLTVIKESLEIVWFLEDVEIKKGDGTIRIDSGENWVEFSIGKRRGKASLRSSDGREMDLNVDREEGTQRVRITVDKPTLVIAAFDILEKVEGALYEDPGECYANLQRVIMYLGAMLKAKAEKNPDEIEELLCDYFDNTYVPRVIEIFGETEFQNSYKKDGKRILGLRKQEGKKEEVRGFLEETIEDIKGIIEGEEKKKR